MSSSFAVSSVAQMTQMPLVSCICITKNSIEILQRAIAYFRAQTYENKELIVLKQSLDPAISIYLENCAYENVTFINASDLPELSLGELRNLAIEKSNGEYFCVWDDDDWYHIDRIKIQMVAVMNSQHPAVALTNELIFDRINNRAFFSLIRLWENSIICKKQVFLEGIKYPPLARGEDAHFLKQLLSKSKVFPLVNGTLYIYIYHGSNTSISFQGLFSVAQELSPAAVKVIETILDNVLSPEEASKILDSSIIPQEINYFDLDKKTIKSFGKQKEAANIEIMRMKARITK